MDSHAPLPDDIGTAARLLIQAILVGQDRAELLLLADDLDRVAGLGERPVERIRAAAIKNALEESPYV